MGRNPEWVKIPKGTIPKSLNPEWSENPNESKSRKCLIPNGPKSQSAKIPKIPKGLLLRSSDLRLNHMP